MKALIYLAIAGLVCACEMAAQEGENTTVKLAFDIEGTKSVDPQDDAAIADANIFVFNSTSGLLEKHVYIDKRQYIESAITVDLLRGVKYDIAACINFGYKFPSPKNREELARARYYMVYPDEYRTGMPMAALEEGVLAADSQQSIRLKAVRLMAKISLCMDRRDLDKDVTMNVVEVTVGGCPKSVTPFSDSKPLGKTDVFGQGFSKRGIAVDNLNKDGVGGKSREIDLYMLESLNGDTPTSMGNPTLATVYPYIEMRLDYYSPRQSVTGQWLMYRFYIGEEEGNSDIRRNTRYLFTVCPHGTGLDLNPSWKVEFTN